LSASSALISSVDRIVSLRSLHGGNSRFPP
jgi:hypothetical protein